MIPVINCGNSVVEKDAEIMHALRTVGFAYLTDCELDFNKVERLQQLMLKFWKLQHDIKTMYVRGSHPDIDYNSGYVPPNMEILDPTKNKNEIREAFNVHKTIEPGNPYMPEAQVPGISEAIRDFQDECAKLNHCILQILQKNLSFKDSGFLEHSHRFLGTNDNATTLRLLHYPPLPDDITPGTQRCGEHSDYGTLTFLFQDEVGGLEVRGRNGNFVPASPVANSVLLNMGDCMQRWTSDQLLAVRHRVLVPENKAAWKETRQSIAFFVHPDDDVPMSNQVIDGSDSKYDNTSAKEYLMEKFRQTY